MARFTWLDAYEGDGDGDLVVRTPLRLTQLAELISDALSAGVPDLVWVVAETSQVYRAASGHTYLDLAESQNGKAVAQMKAVVWARDHGMIDRFEAEAGRQLGRGMEVLLLVEPRFHGLYGLSLTIHAFDANYTLGSLARDKQRVRERLAAAGHLERNKALGMPPAPIRIAVISSAQAAGYQDFEHTLAANARGFRFQCRLFPAGVQGADAPVSIAKAFDRVAADAARFDVVALIRGGGSELDLACFDSWEVACAAACCPLPVLTGIGHERDQSLADEVAHTRCKTPTSVAEMLIDICCGFQDHIADLGRRLVGCAQAAAQRDEAALQTAVSRIHGRSREALSASEAAVRALVLRYRSCTQAAVGAADRALDGADHRLRAASRDRLRTAAARARDLGGRCTASATRAVAAAQRTSDGVAQRLARTSQICVHAQAAHLAAAEGRTPRAARLCLERQISRLHLATEHVRLLDPARVLARGYSLTYWQGQVVTRASVLAPGAQIVTRLHEGTVESTVDTTED